MAHGPHSALRSITRTKCSPRSIWPVTPVLACVFGLGCVEGDKASTTSERDVQYSSAGDTAVVRNTGIETVSGRVDLERDLVIGHDSGGPGRDLVNVVSLYPMPDGGAIVSEAQLRVRLFDSAGRFVRQFGARGTGPGEYIAPMSVMRDSSGSVFVTRLPHGINVYDSLGNFRAGWKLPFGGGMREWHVNPDGVTLKPITVQANGAAPGAPEYTAILRMGKNGEFLDTSTVQPTSFGPPPVMSFTGGANGMERRFVVPLSPEFITSFGPPGAWVYGNSGRYEILVRNVSGRLLRIEGDASAPVLPLRERDALAATLTAELRGSVPRAEVKPSLLPKAKPFFKALTLDVEGRVWVELHQPATSIVETGCPATSRGAFAELGTGSFAATLCADSAPPRPITKLVEPKVYDMFATSGEFLGRVSLPARSRYLSARAGYLWLVERDNDDVESIVRYRMKLQRAR